MKLILETDRLLFREFTTDDAPLIYELNSDPLVVKYVHEHPVSNIDIALSNIADRILPQYSLYGYGRWAVHLKTTNEFIGWCGLKYRPEIEEIDLGYRFQQKYWGKGYATEAAKATLAFGFANLQLPIITARAHIENLASLKVIENCGMHFIKFEEVDGCPVKTYALRNSQV